LADAGVLPVADASVDALVLINAFLFPSEVDRVLRPGGSLLWVNSSGPQTPIHLTTDEVVDALPFAVAGFESGAGAGTWAALQRHG
jgi:ubiquinone/menaquinone biosynthesis C-methylase UbiE